MLKRILLTTLFVLLTAAAGTGYFLFAGDYVRAREDAEVCDAIDVVIRDSLENALVSRSDVLDFIDGGRQILGHRRDSILIDSLEKRLLQRGEIRYAEIFTDNGGNLRIELLQRHASIRLSGEGREFYSDSTGYLFPVYNKTDVPLVTGFIPVSYTPGQKGYPSSERELAWMRDMAGLVSYIENHYYWHKTIEQIDIEKNGDIVFYMRDAAQRFIFGDFTDIPGKFAKMATYYKGIAPLPEAADYTTVNLKYDKQIICR